MYVAGDFFLIIELLTLKRADVRILLRASATGNEGELTRRRIKA
jgi:hypothetical protein